MFWDDTSYHVPLYLLNMETLSMHKREMTLLVWRNRFCEIMPQCPKCENMVPLVRPLKAPYYGSKTIDGDIVTYCSACRQWYRWTRHSTFVFGLSTLFLNAAAGAVIMGLGMWIAGEFGIDQENEWLVMALVSAMLISVLCVMKLLSGLVTLELLPNEE